MHDAAPHLFNDQRGGGAMGRGGRGTGQGDPRHPGHVGRDHGEPGEHIHDNQLVQGVTQSQPGIFTFFKSYMQRS